MMPVNASRTIADIREFRIKTVLCAVSRRNLVGFYSTSERNKGVNEAFNLDLLSAQ